MSGLALADTLRIGKLVVESDKRLTVGIETLDGGVAQCVVGIVVAAFLVFGLVIDGGTVNLYLAGRPVALEVLHVGGSIP